MPAEVKHAEICTIYIFQFHTGLRPQLAHQLPAARGVQVLLKGPPSVGGEGRPRMSLLKGPPMVGGEGRLPGEVGGKLAATD